MPYISKETYVPLLNIHRLSSQDDYNSLLSSGDIEPNDIYLVPGGKKVTVTSDIPMSFSINENGGLRITYDDGSDV